MTPITPPITSAQLEELFDQIDWYRICLNDVANGLRVTGLSEAEAGYKSAIAKIQEALG